jgi:hypothetical protein
VRLILPAQGETQLQSIARIFAAANLHVCNVLSVMKAADSMGERDLVDLCVSFALSRITELATSAPFSPAITATFVTRVHEHVKGMR